MKILSKISKWKIWLIYIWKYVIKENVFLCLYSNVIAFLMFRKFLIKFLKSERKSKELSYEKLIYKTSLSMGINGNFRWMKVYAPATLADHNWNLETASFKTSLISGQCSHFTPHEKSLKPQVYWCFQGM